MEPDETIENEDTPVVAKRTRKVAKADVTVPAFDGEVVLEGGTTYIPA